MKPGTRQSLAVLGYLDRHRAQQLDFPDVRGRAVCDLTQRAHDAVGIAGLEEFDRTEGARHVFEQPLQILRGRRL